MCKVRDCYGFVTISLISGKASACYDFVKISLNPGKAGLRRLTRRGGSARARPLIGARSGPYAGRWELEWELEAATEALLNFC